MTDLQQALDLGPALVAPSGPWVTRCGDPGPYSIRRPTERNISRLEVLRCTRPADHDRTLHMSAEPDGRVLAAWTSAGLPHWPPVITERSTDASDVPL
jgi:hypothetical protein